MPAKPCIDCGEVKPLEEFHVNRARSDGRLNHCKPCEKVRRKCNYERNKDQQNAYSAQWVLDNPEKHSAQKIRSAIRKHGVTVEWYQQKLEEQGGACGLCRIASDKRLTIDHDHSCCPGKFGCAKCIRGLICHTCNTGLGMFGDNVEVLKMAIRYLSDFGFMGAGA